MYTPRSPERGDAQRRSRSRKSPGISGEVGHSRARDYGTDNRAMPAKTSPNRLLQLTAFAITGVFVLGFVYAPVGVWTGPILAAWFIGTQKAWRGFLWLAGIGFVLNLVSNWCGSPLTRIATTTWCCSARTRKAIATSSSWYPRRTWTASTISRASIPTCWRRIPRG